MNYLILVLASVAAYSFSVVSNLITTKLSAIRDPLEAWEILNNVDLLPIRLRARIFSTLVGIANPYSRSINFRITELRKGKACGVLRVNYVDFFFCSGKVRGEREARLGWLYFFFSSCPWRILSRQWLQMTDSAATSLRRRHSILNSKKMVEVQLANG